jgi:DNA-binding CsgD family transcriptional regulator
VSLLEVAGRHGVARDALLHGLALDGFDERAPFGRMAWDEYAEVFDRLEVALGGPAATEAFSREVLQSSRAIRALAAQILDLEQLTRFGFERLGPALFHHVGTRVDVTPDRRMRVEFAIPAGARGSMPWARANIATLDAYAALLGLPEVRVSGDLHPHGGVLRCALPTPRTLQARAAAALRAGLDALVFGAADERDDLAPIALAHDLPEEVTDHALAEAANEIGQRLAGLDDLAALARELDAHLRSRFLVADVRLLVRRGGSLDPALPSMAADVSRAGATLVRPLYALGRDVGRLEVDLDPAARPRELDLLVPFVALGVDRCLATSARPGGAPPASTAGRAPEADAPSPWSLTPRERAVLDLVLRGLANKDVAATLGCGVKNVESALSRLFRKVGVENRTALVGEVLRVGRSLDA